VSRFISVITPTIQRDSLFLCCESINQQSFTDWQHIVIVDCERLNLPMMAKIAHPQRTIIKCQRPHRNFGHSCRHEAWKYTDSTWVSYCDDDNFYAHDDVFAVLNESLRDAEHWAIAPILHHSGVLFNDPPGLNATDTANMIIRRELAQWPNRSDYQTDGIFCEELKAQYPYKALANIKPIIAMPFSSLGS
jgi:glycosyltransferase involved in cell wall biosynthesis